MPFVNQIRLVWTRFMVGTLLRNALTEAVRRNKLHENPCIKVAKPKPARKEMQTYNSTEVKKLLEASKLHLLHAFFVLAVTSGMREGELFGLDWSKDIDLKPGTVKVQRSLEQIGNEFRLKGPKSKSGIRTIRLPRFAVLALASLEPVSVCRLLPDMFAASTMQYSSQGAEVIRYHEVLPMKTFTNFGLVAAVVVIVFAVQAMGQEPRPGGGLQPPIDLRPDRVVRPVATQIVDLEGVDEPVTVEMSDIVRITGRGIAGAVITIDVKGAGRLSASNNVRKIKDGLGSQVKEFLIQPTKPGKMTVKVAVRNPAGGIGRTQVQEYEINV